MTYSPAGPSACGPEYVLARGGTHTQSINGEDMTGGQRDRQRETHIHTQPSLHSPRSSSSHTPTHRTCTHINSHTHTHARVRADKSAGRPHAHAHTHTHTPACTCAPMHPCTHINSHTHTHARTRARARTSGQECRPATCPRPHPHTRIHVRTHAPMHPCTQSEGLLKGLPCSCHPDVPNCL